MEKQLDFTLSETQMKFVTSDASVVVLVGPMGEGKTFAGIMSMLYHAKRIGRPLHAAIIRDTHENIKLSTAKSISNELGSIAKFKNDYKELTIFSKPRITCHLFGIDDPASVSKLQGPEFGLIWLEEPAPMVDRANAGLSEDVFNAALARSVRQSNCRGRLQITMNPADEDHWTYRRLIATDMLDENSPEVTKHVYFIQPFENEFLSDYQRKVIRAAFKNDPTAYKRYVEGKFARNQFGMRVTPEYNPQIHLSLYPISPKEGWVGFRSWDSWESVTCIMGQISPTGRIFIYDVLTGAHTDIRTFIEVMVKPMLNSPRWRDKCKAWRDIGDITMRQHDQSNINESAARVIERAFGTFFEGGPKMWDTLRRRTKYALLKNTIEGPLIVINRDATLLDRALDGGWHYKTDNSGNIIGDVPNKKNIYSHIGDAFANAISVLVPMEDKVINFDRYIKVTEKLKRRVATYS